MVHLKSKTDTEDIFQTVFLKYALSSVAFKNPEHEKAWIIRVTINACKDFLKSFFRSRTVPLEELRESHEFLPEDDSHVLEAVMALPEKYKDIVYLHYYEDYPATDIARMMKKNVNTVYTHLHRARGILRQSLGGEEFE